MRSPNNELGKKQVIFREMVLGTLVYSVVLGFFNDYTSVLYTESYSTTFLVAFVMQVLTYLTLLIKRRVAASFRQKTGTWNTTGLVVCIWLVLFLSKFVFLGVIDFLFGSYVTISGFIGLVAIILSMTIAKEIIDHVFNKLAD